MLRAGFAALPYMVLRDVSLTMGARLIYAVLLMYAWQEGSCFPGQMRMSADVGISQRNLRRFLAELRDQGYISWRKHMPGGTNTYFIHDVKTKLKTKAKRPAVASRRGQDRPLDEDRAVHQIDSVNETQRNRLSNQTG